MIQLDIVCPIYKNSDTLEALVKSFYSQKNIEIKNIVFFFFFSHSEEDDRIHNIIAKYNITSFDVEIKDFSHSLTREKAIRDYCKSRIVVMISQDIVLNDENAFYNLTKSIDEKETVYNFAKQVSKYKSIERYIRQKNYPSESYYVTKDDIERMQFMAYYASDACSAYDRDVFLKVGGYQGYDIMMSEDALYSKVILDAGYAKKYCADAVVEHSHKYSLKQLYRRYYGIGVFESQVSLFGDVKIESSGKSLAFYVLGQAFKHFDIPVIFRWLPDMAARYLGRKKGMKEGRKQ